MGRNLEGGCQCGAVRYRVTGEPLTLYACHCSECQKQSASAFGLSLRIKASDLELVSGAPKFWERPADSGDTVACAFCRNCGSRLYHVGHQEPEIVSIKAGSLDDTSRLSPVGHIWTRSKQPWVSTESGLDSLVFETEPPDYGEFFRRWKAASKTSNTS